MFPVLARHVIAEAIVVGTFIALAASQGTAHAQPASPAVAAAKAPVYCDGDAWRIAQTEFMKRGMIHVQVSSTAKGGNTTFAHTLEGETAKVGARIEVRSPDGNRLQLGDVGYSPETQAYQFPLHVGKSWAVDYSFLDDAANANPSGGYKPADVPSRRVGTATVTAYEKITTPAGTFDAYRIEQQGTLTQPATQGASPSYDSQYFETNWYAPAAKASMKYDYRHTSPRRVTIIRSSELVNAVVNACE